MLSPEQFARVIASYPPIPHDLAQMSPEERRGLLPSLPSLYVPMPYQYAIYDTLYRAIATTYRTADVVESTRAINAYYCGQSTNYATQADSGSILGIPGCGKTATVRRCLSTMPQVIEHVEYQGQPLYCKQVTWLRVECPSDCSIKTLGFNVMAALDKAIGSHYLDSAQGLRSVSASAIATQTKILLANNHVGLLVMDQATLSKFGATLAKTRQKVKQMHKATLAAMPASGRSIFASHEVEDIIFYRVSNGLEIK